jgi:hypothetical protein
VCTFVLVYRPGTAWPLLAAANRDEMLARPWQPPAEHWPDLPGVIGGRDTLAGGTWLAINAHGVVAAVLNRTGSLGPAEGKRSRGELPLMALTHSSAREAAAALSTLDAGAWRSFNLVVADAQAAFFACGLEQGPVQIQPLESGLTMVTSGAPNDITLPRIARHLPRFAAAPAPAPPEWGQWPALLADRSGPLEAALNVPETHGFGTVSSALVAARAGDARFLFAGGAPGSVAFQEVKAKGSR